MSILTVTKRDGKYSVTVTGNPPEGDYRVTEKDSSRANIEALSSAIGKAAPSKAAPLTEAAFSKAAGNPDPDSVIESVIETLRVLDAETRESRVRTLSSLHTAVPVYRALKTRFGTASGKVVVTYSR